MSTTLLTFDDVKDASQSEQWVDMTLRCVELWDPYEIDFVDSPEKCEQVGLLEDADGETLRFVSWKNSNPPELETDETYDFEDLFLVYGRNKDGEGFKFIFRSKTKGETSTTGFGQGSGGAGGSGSAEATCTSCSAVLTDEHLHEGPDAPEIGWEYFECDDCGHRMRPELVSM